MTKKGFTLIELLIVVAIIAILAAIAIPNFLAAQTRSKVSRAKSELATLATALESYFVDNNEYPPCVVPFVDVAMYVPNVITSPIAYLASNNFLDPFRAPDAAATYMRYRYMDVDSLYGKGSASAEAYGSFYGKWRISSSGPDRIFGPTGYLTYQGVSYNILCPYDPTNGTVSNGDIMRSQKKPDEDSSPR
jgi:prepilin-type N-terminal cleavage/methylation domain-containing protein